MQDEHTDVDGVAEWRIYKRLGVEDDVIEGPDCDGVRVVPASRADDLEFRMRGMEYVRRKDNEYLLGLIDKLADALQTQAEAWATLNASNGATRNAQKVAAEAIKAYIAHKAA